MMKVWAIFSIENNYYQPDNNLVKLYRDKPTFEQLLRHFFESRDISEIEEIYLIGIVEMLRGGEYEDINRTSYRLELVNVE